MMNYNSWHQPETRPLSDYYWTILSRRESKWTVKLSQASLGSQKGEETKKKLSHEKGRKNEIIPWAQALSLWAMKTEAWSLRK